jgi:ubiquinone/menaquinone biosynthesis C-methylase UbiE
MKDTFNKQAEREYYNDSTDQLIITDTDEVDNLLQLCTNSRAWPSLLEGKNILEIGAGLCSFLPAFLQKATPKLYIASDLFVDRLLIPKKLGSYQSIEFISGDVLHLPVKDNSMDLCMAFGLLHHIPNLEDVFREIARILKVGGRFIFRDPWAGNPAVWLKFKFGHASENEFPLNAKTLRNSLVKHGLKPVYMNQFWIRFPWLPSGPWSTNIGGLAAKE